MSGFVLRRLQPHAETIVRAYSHGISFEELAERFNCSWQTIRRFLLSQEVPLRPAIRTRKLEPYKREVIAAYRAGTNVAAIAARFSVQPQTVRNFVVDQLARVS